MALTQIVMIQILPFPAADNVAAQCTRCAAVSHCSLVPNADRLLGKHDVISFSLPPFPYFCPLPFSFSSLFAEELTEQWQQQQQHFLVVSVGGSSQRDWRLSSVLCAVLLFLAGSRLTHIQWRNQQPHAA